MNKLALIKILLISILFSGCFSMNYDFKGGVAIDPSIKSYSVDYFKNTARLVEPTFSQTFTQDLKDHIESNTSLRLVNGRGDVQFSGTIITYEITPQAISSGETAANTRFTIGVKVKYTNSINPDDDFEKVFSQYRDFESTTSFSTVQESLSEEIVDDIIEQIFNAAFVNW